MTQCIDTQACNITTPPIQPGIWAAIAYFFKTHAQRRADLAGLRELSKLHPDTLKDIGLTHGDITWAKNLPVEQAAVKELERVKRYGASQ